MGWIKTDNGNLKLEGGFCGGNRGIRGEGEGETQQELRNLSGCLICGDVFFEADWKVEK